MIATSEVLQAAAESLPGEPPTERDLQIFTAVKIDARRQVDVAAEFAISQSRVSQIIRHVSQWRLATSTEAGADSSERRIVDGWIDAQRLESLYEHTLALFRRTCEPKRREKKGTNQHGEWQAQTIDHPPGNLQCLRLASQLLELRWKLLEKCPPPAPLAFAHAPESKVIEKLVSMRHLAEVRGDVRRSEEPGQLVKRLLDELLGRGPNCAMVDDLETRELDRRDDALVLAAGGHAPATASQELATGSQQPRAGATHTTHNMSTDAGGYEAEGGADRRDASSWRDTPYGDRSAAVEGCDDAGNELEKSSISMSAATAGLVNSDSQPGRGNGRVSQCLAEEEREALATLDRAFETERKLGAEDADGFVPSLLAEGQANLMLQGFTRLQRQALLRWQRFMERRKRESGVGGRESGGRSGTGRSSDSPLTSDP